MAGFSSVEVSCVICSPFAMERSRRRMKDFYWDIRPKPEFGTIELRVCDTPLTVDRAAQIAVYLQALCSLILAGEDPAPQEDDYLVYTYNRFQACRFGLEGLIVHPRGHAALPLRDDILGTLQRVLPHAERLGSHEALTALHDMSTDSLTLRQQQILQLIRDAVAERGSPPTRAEIAQAFGFRSPNAAESHLRALARKGVIALDEGRARGIRLAEAPGLPLIGRVAAGSPILAEAHADR